MRHVADRMPDRGKRGKDIAILQMGQDVYTWVTIKLFLHTQVCWWHEAKSPDPATRSELTQTRGYARCFLDLGQPTRDGRTVDAAVTMVAAASVTMLDLICASHFGFEYRSELISTLKVAECGSSGGSPTAR